MDFQTHVCPLAPTVGLGGVLLPVHHRAQLKEAGYGKFNCASQGQVSGHRAAGENLFRGGEVQFE